MGKKDKLEKVSKKATVAETNVLNAIGLSTEVSKTLTEKLNFLLADYSVFYMNVRGFHWNIRGEKFFELHLKFEELYNDLILKIDEVAERILTLGGEPFHSYSAYLQRSSIVVVEGESDGKRAVKHILSSLKTLLVLQRDIMELASEAGDEGTSALMSDYVRAQEKLVWMYSAYVG